jgi:hypothetical protein
MMQQAREGRTNKNAQLLIGYFRAEVNTGVQAFTVSRISFDGAACRVRTVDLIVWTKFRASLDGVAG